MVFVFGVNFPESRLVKVFPLTSPPRTKFLPKADTPSFPKKQRSLESFYGIGPLVSQRLMARLYINPTAKIGSLGNEQVLRLNAELSNMPIENDLRRTMRENIRRLKDMGSHRGRRHAMGMPVRGQRTRTQTATATKLNKVERYG